MVFIFGKLQEADVQEYIGKLDEMSRAQMSYHLISRLDWFVSGIQGVSLDYENVAAIAGRNPDELKLIAYTRIVKRFSDDVNDFEKAVYGGRRIDPSFSIMPTGQMNKKPRFSQDLPLLGEAPRNAGWQGNDRRTDPPAASQRGTHQGDGRQAVGRQGGARGGYGGGVWGAPSGNPTQRTPDEKRRLGDITLRPGSTPVILAGNLSLEYCPDFQVIGRYCENQETCNLKHVPINRWGPEDKGKQIAHVELMKSNMRFRAGVKYLPQNMRHLLAPGEPANARRR